ncbi:MAG: WYL domain-containing protein [Polyangiaceae bacterium]|jgi:hypothetical protein|nr:WYL domain-containing protein [Polyangiaceae bacterium]
MPPTTGRAVSAAIHNRLREALTSGEPETYAQLAQRAGCTVRSVRNYLARSQEIFGFDIERSRNGGHAVVVRAVGVSRPPSVAPVDDPLLSLERAFCRTLLLGSCDPQAPAPSQPIFVALRGLPAYSLHHASALRDWLRACQTSPRTAVRLRLQGPTRELAERALWPVGLVFHNVEGLLLIGLPLEADALNAITWIELSTLLDDIGTVCCLDRAATGDPLFDLDHVDVRDLLDLPFCAPISDGALVDVHVRFSADIAPRLRSRVWHRTQRVVLRRDGSVDVRFGPVELAAAASWAASYGAAVRVMGDKRLRKAVKKRNFSP